MDYLTIHGRITCFVTVNSALLPKDCSDALTMDVTESGVYAIQPLDSGRPFNVYCDMDTDGGGWTVSWIYVNYFVQMFGFFIAVYFFFT